MAEYTSGSWQFWINDDGIVDPSAEVFVKDGGPGRCVIATIEHQPEYLANARLIAAAPDLLAAMRMVCDSGISLAEPIEQAMLAAIAKATHV